MSMGEIISDAVASFSGIYVRLKIQVYPKLPKFPKPPTPTTLNCLSWSRFPPQKLN